MSTSADQSRRANRGPAAGPANRAALIAAAREVYAESGVGAPFSAVAKRAGVGQGSLYRHFPDRTALAAAVFEENLAELERIAAPSDSTLDDLLDAVLDQVLVSTSLITLLTADPHDPRVAHLGERYRDVVTTLLRREHAAGHIDESITPEDVLLATEMLAFVLARTEPDAKGEVAARGRKLLRAAFRGGTH